LFAHSAWVINYLMLELSSCRHLKLHFDTPGVPQSESLSHLAHGMTKARAARLFYQIAGMYSLRPKL
jgi:hypothetical protein